LNFLSAAGGEFYSIATDVSSDGSTVVGFGTSDDGRKAFIWDSAHGMRTVEEILRSHGIDVSGWDLSEATSVSADGRTIVGTGRNPSGIASVWLAAVPEPSTGLLFSLGLVGIAIRRAA